MRTLLLATIVALFSVTMMPSAPAGAATVGSSWVEGTLVHVSTTNIKIINDKTGQSQSFLLVPHFDQIFSKDGKTTYQVKQLTRNELLKIYYDQKSLGARHADRIVVVR